MNGYLTALSVQFWNIKFSEYISNMEIFRIVTEKKILSFTFKTTSIVWRNISVVI